MPSSSVSISKVSSPVRIDHGFGALIHRRIEQFVEQPPRKEHRMAAFAAAARHDDVFFRFVKLSDHPVDQARVNVGMVDEMNEHAVAVRIGQQVPHRDLQRRQLSQLVIWIDENFYRQRVQSRRLIGLHCDPERR